MLLSGAAGVATAVPASIRKALAIDPAEGSDFYEAEHVVILMQENRSFDHCYGALRGVRGFNDPRAITLPDNKPVWLQTNKKNETYAPFRFNLEDSKITWMGSVPHSRASQVDANNLGKYDGWLEAKRSGNPAYKDMPLTLGYYNREDLPFGYAMADAFTICDQHFSSAMTSTWPNRLYLWGGTIREEKNSDSKAFIRNDIPYGEARWETFPELLEQNGVSWRVYQNDLSSFGGYKGTERAWLSNFGCNPLEFLSQYQLRYHPGYLKNLLARAVTLRKELERLEAEAATTGLSAQRKQKLQATITKKKEVLQDTQSETSRWSNDRFEKLSSYQKSIFDRAFTNNQADPNYRKLTQLRYSEKGETREVELPAGDVLYQFRKDVDSGKLPTVSWLVPSQNFSDHPSAPWYGTWMTSEVLDILTNNPEVWKKTIFILTYDENDGYFDHVPPYVAPDPEEPLTGAVSHTIKETAAEQVSVENEWRDGISKKAARGGPIGLGFRVPMIIASPWTRGGKVCSEVFDHTSPIQFLEKFLSKKMGKQIRQETITDWRRAISGNLVSAFTKFEQAKQEPLPFLDRNQTVQQIYNAKFKQLPTGFKSLSKQEIKDFMDPNVSSPWRPKQEGGTRPSLALPYELYAEGLLDPGTKKVQLSMKAADDIFGAGAAGAPFAVYAHGGYLTLEAEKQNKKAYDPVRVWHFATTPGSEVSYQWPLAHFEKGVYDLRLYGPNGFYRGFKGGHEDPKLKLSLKYGAQGLLKKSLTGSLLLEIENVDPNVAYHILLVDKAYGKKDIHKKVPAASKVQLEIDLSSSQSWYDFTLRLADHEGAFERHYAGRVETGMLSISDPQIAKS